MKLSFSSDEGTSGLQTHKKISNVDCTSNNSNPLMSVVVVVVVTFHLFRARRSVTPAGYPGAAMT